MHVGLPAVGHVGVGPQPTCHMGMVSVQIGWIKAALCWSLLNIGGEGATAVLWKREQLCARWALSVDFKFGSVSNSGIPAIWNILLSLIVSYFNCGNWLFSYLHLRKYINSTLWNFIKFRSRWMFAPIFTHDEGILIKPQSKQTPKPPWHGCQSFFLMNP